MLEIDKGVLWPKLLSQFFSRYYVARILEKHAQDLEGLRGELNLHATATQLFRFKVPLIETEADDSQGFTLVRAHVVFLKRTANIPVPELTQFCFRRASA